VRLRGLRPGECHAGSAQPQASSAGALEGQGVRAYLCAFPCTCFACWRERESPITEHQCRLQGTRAHVRHDALSRARLADGVVGLEL